MEKYLDKRSQIRPRTVSSALPTMEHKPSNAAESPHLPGERSALRFPPTRAARASRSRGVFLGDRDDVPGGVRLRWIEPLGAFAALVIAALALAVCVNTTSTVAGLGLGANPGPAIVAAASVAPPFIVPVEMR
jgi:hypothetical protein